MTSIRLSLDELKEKLAQAAQFRSNAQEITRYYRREGNVHVVLRKFEDTP